MTRRLFTPQQECLRQLSMNIWRCRGAAKRSGLNYNEETVTEGLLLALQVNFPGNVLIVPFTKRREGAHRCRLGMGVCRTRRTLLPGDASAGEAPR